MSEKTTGIKSGDVLMVALAVGLAVFSMVALARAGNGGKGGVAVIEVNGRELHRVKLGEDRKITVRGSRGTSTVEFRGNRVRMLESTCRDKICVHTGWIDSAGQSVVCLPNRVVIRILGRGVDGTTE